MLKGFKDFLIRGNVIDLAVGLIMGTAFTAVVTSLVQAVLMPAISMLIGSPNFDDFLVFGQVKIGVFLGRDRARPSEGDPRRSGKEVICSALYH